jgi:hypothetical protein
VIVAILSYRTNQARASSRIVGKFGDLAHHDAEHRVFDLEAEPESCPPEIAVHDAHPSRVQEARQG